MVGTIKFSVKFSRKILMILFFLCTFAAVIKLKID